MSRKQTRGRGRPRKLTVNQVRSIRGSRYANSTVAEIATDFDVCSQTVTNVLGRRGAYRSH